VVWKYAQMHKNTFLAPPDVKKLFFKDLVLVVWKWKNNFLRILILVVWKYAQMYKNTFLATQDVNKVFFKDLILVVWKCIKTRF